MADPLNDIPATLLSELTDAYSDKQSKRLYAVLGQNV
jgi:hypothetical protein